jgi:ATP-dependent Clp protease protease subunit
MNVASMDVFSRLMMDRIIFLGEGINDYVANIVTAQLLFLESTDRPGISRCISTAPVEACMPVWVFMIPCSSSVPMWLLSVQVWPPVWGQILLCAGIKGKRTALKHSRVMIHQPSGAIGGQATISRSLQERSKN